jgi:hypothetical protein
MGNPFYTEVELYDPGWDFEYNHMTFRCKWIADGSRTLDEVIAKLQDTIRHVQCLKEQGWELESEMTDDMGNLQRGTPIEYWGETAPLLLNHSTSC